MKRMKVLSLTQPWASLVVTKTLEHGYDGVIAATHQYGIKNWETRSWQTNYRGEILIHASKEYNPEVLEIEPFARFKELLNPLPLGYIIGKVELVNIVSTTFWLGHQFIKNKELFEIQKGLGDYRPKRFAWKFINPEKFAFPIPADGSLSLWNYKMENSGERPLDDMNGHATVSPMITEETWKALNDMARLAYNMKIPKQ